MADINSHEHRPPAPHTSLPNAELSRDAHRPSDEQLLAYVELLFFAYRDFTSDPDSILQQLGFGRAHHRVLHFVERYPGLRVAELLQILKITKQSLARVLRELVAAGHVVQETGASDRRERLLFTTKQGAALAHQLARPQIERIARTLASVTAGADGQPGPNRASPNRTSPNRASPNRASQDSARMFLYHMITPGERAAVDALMARRASKVEHPPQRGSS